MPWIATAGPYISAGVAAIVGTAALWRATLAHRLAKQAEERNLRIERRQTERGDIRWSAGEWAPGYIWQLRNEGIDSAHNVTLEVVARPDLLPSYPEDVRREDSALVQPGEYIGVPIAASIHNMLSRYKNEQTRRLRAEDDNYDSRDPLPPPQFIISATVFCTTEHGSVRSQEVAARTVGYTFGVSEPRRSSRPPDGPDWHPPESMSSL